uniref:Uncharacterized protein n=1 Tax=Chrysotila carterae TaxID=13221 RepID=A0A7S4B4G3_CHRCT
MPGQKRTSDSWLSDDWELQTANVLVIAIQQAPALLVPGTDCRRLPAAVGLASDDMMFTDCPQVKSSWRVVRAHAGGTLAAAFGSEVLVSAGADSRVGLWYEPGWCSHPVPPVAHVINADGGVRGRHGAMLEELSVNRHIWAVAAGRVVAVGGSAPTDEVSYLGPLPHGVDAVQVLDDGSVTAACFGGVMVWRPAPPSSLECTGKKSYVPAVFSVHDGTFVPPPTQMLASLPFPGWPRRLAASAAGGWLAAAAWSGAVHTVRLWRLCDGTEFVCTGFSEQLAILCWSEDGSWLACASGATVSVWEFPLVNEVRGPPAGAAPRRYEGASSVTALCFAPVAASTPSLACAYADGSLLLLSIEARKTTLWCEPLSQLTPASGECVEHIAWARLGDGRQQMLLASSGSQLRSVTIQSLRGLEESRKAARSHASMDF